MTTPAAVMERGPQTTAPQPTDLRLLAPFYLMVILNSYAATLFCTACYDFADKELHAPPAQRLWMSAAWGLAYIFISLSAGKISEKFGPRRALFVLLPLAIAASLLALLIMKADWRSSSAVWLLAALMLPFNIASSSCWPALESAISKSAGKLPLPTRMMLYNLCWSGAGFAAFFTRGALEQTTWSLIFIAPAIALALSFLTLSALSIFREGPPKSIEPEANETPAVTQASRLHPPAIRKRAVTLLHMAWIGNALAYVAINVITPVLMKMADRAGIAENQLAIAAIVTSIWGFSRVAGFLLVGTWPGWHYKARWLVGAQFALAAAFLLMMVVPNLWILLAAQILFGLSTALIYSSSLYYAMHTSEGSGGHAGFHEALIGLGIFIGPAVGALAGAAFPDGGIARIGSSVVLVLGAGAALMAWMGRKNPKSETRNPKLEGER